MPAEPINVILKISDKVGAKKTHQENKIEACSAVDRDDDVLKSGNFLSVHDAQLKKWNGGDEVNEKGDLKNIRMEVTIE
jgi:hypothetical protein